MWQANSCHTLRDAVENHRRALAIARARAQALMTVLHEAEASFSAVEAASAQVQQALNDTLACTESAGLQVNESESGTKRPREEVATSQQVAGASSEANLEGVSAPPSTHVGSGAHACVAQYSAYPPSLTPSAPLSSVPSSTPPCSEPSAPPPPSAPPSAGVGMEANSSANSSANSEALPAQMDTRGSARAWLGALVREVNAAAAENASRVSFDGRMWHAKRSFCVSDTLPQGGAAIELHRLLPTKLAVVYAERATTKDAQALRATGSPPPGVSPEQAAKLLLSGACDERLVITGLRNMFMQSGVPAAMYYELISVPPNGLCVWLVLALLTARCDARRGHRTEPHVLTSGAVLDVLRTLHTGALSGDRILPEAIARIEGADSDASWDQISGERSHCGNIHDACEALAAGWGVHVPVLVLARHETRDAFSIAVIVYGDEDAPSIFGPRGGALVTYQAFNDSGPLLSHVDVLVSSAQA